MPSANSARVLLTIFLLSLGACSMFRGKDSAPVDDGALTTQVKQAYVTDGKLNTMMINVETIKGIVQLSGFVDSAATESRAVQLAQDIDGVKAVQDNLIVKEPKTAPPAP